MDDLLLKALKRGSHSAYTTIVDELRPKLRWYLRKKLRLDFNTAKDILAEVFLTLWEKREILDERFEAYLMVVAHNKAMDFYRARKRDRLAAYEKAAQVLDQSSPSEEVGTAQGLSKLASQCVEMLSPQQKAIVEAMVNRTLTDAELAVELDSTEGSIRNQRNRARKALKNCLESKR